MDVSQVRVEVVLQVKAGGPEVGKSNGVSGQCCPMDYFCLNRGQRDHVVDRNSDNGGGVCPTDWVRQNGDH